MAKTKRHSVFIPIYEQQLTLIATDPENFARHVHEFNPDADIGKLRGCAGIATYKLTDQGQHYAIIMQERPRVSYLAHEIVHIVNWLMSYVGITHDVDNDEPQAYLTGYLSQIVFDFFRPNYGKK